MSPHEECAREADVLEVLSSGRWPDHCTAEMRSHVDACEICRDVIEVARALQEDYARVAPTMRIPSAGLVWWRAELRSRREAARQAERPLSLYHAFAGACVFGVVAALLVQLSAPFSEAFTSFYSWMPDAPFVIPEQHLVLVVSVAALLVLAPLAFYFVFSDKK